ncbi:hypothetical protein VB711_22060 [Cronbergia sp. UHCC 0137]|nr:hypothetical protein [Cronbergia sp. UHCC 0137]MEA5620505.1 hypothetical protein [Cronbergia sp. UHCC 0137]
MGVLQYPGFVTNWIILFAEFPQAKMGMELLELGWELHQFYLSPSQAMCE